MKRTPVLLGESGASVARVTSAHGSSWMEKAGSPEEIALEAEILRWCEGRLPAAKVLEEQSGVIRMSELPGSPLFKVPMDVACFVLADALTRIHALPVDSCPFRAGWSRRLREAERRITDGLVDAQDFDEENLGRTPGSILAELQSFPPLPERHCFTHGDATLENFLAHEGKLGGIVDLGRAGVTHPAQDWALALRSVKHHFGPEGEHQLSRYLPQDCAEASLLRRFCLLDELF